MKFFDDDMDELFNKAGSQYPLKTEPKNWEAVRRALIQEQGLTGAAKDNRSWWRLLPLLLLLLILSVYILLDRDNISDKAIMSSENNNQSNLTTSSTDININGNTQLTFDDPQSPVKKEPTENTSKINHPGIKPLANAQPAKQGSENKNNADEIKDVNIKGGLSGFPKAGNEQKKPDRITSLTPSNDINGEPAAWNSIQSLNTGIIGINAPSEVISLDAPVRYLNQSNGSQSVPNSAKKTKHKKGIYYGLIAGPDFTMIKGQKITGVGYSAGVIMGYILNNRWQLEGGVLWSMKKYYTDGKYFSKEGAQIPSNITVHWLDGGCEMLEFPIIARYNFSAKKNTFFGSAGLTSYIMKHEEYNYLAQRGASGNNYPGYKEYERSGDHLFANLQLSGGYKYSLTSKLNIRIEPYLKMPLKKIGIGKMPITSTGLYFTITRDFR